MSNDELTVIAVVSSKGGVGKTTLTVGIAPVMANRGNKVLIADTDTQDRGSADQWLDGTKDQVPRLSWSKADPKRLTRDALGGLGYDIVILDTPPQIAAEDVAAVLALADLVLIPVGPDEDDIAIQTLRSIEVIQPDLPCRAVINRVLSVSLKSAEMVDTIEEMHKAGLETIGAVHSLRGLSKARRDGRLLTEASGDAGKRAWENFGAVVDEINAVTGSA